MTMLIKPDTVHIKDEAVFADGLIRQDQETGDCEAVDQFILRWVRSEQLFKHDFKVELEDIEGDGSIVRFSILEDEDEDGYVKWVEFWPSEGNAFFWINSLNFEVPYTIELNNKALADVFCALSRWHQILVRDKRVEFNLPFEDISYRKKTAMAEALITTEVYDAFKAYHDELKANGEYPYNSCFINQVEGLVGVPLELQDTAIYIMQCRYADDKCDEHKRALVNSGYRHIGLEPDLANSRKKYDQVLLFTGPSSEQFDSARVCYDKDGVANFILPKGKRNRGRSIHWNTVVGGYRCGIDLLAR